MINPLSIAIGGLRPGASPLEISTGGLIVRIQPAPVEEDVECGLYPVRWQGAPKPRKDCVVEVTGCEATLSATAWNLWDYTEQENLFSTPEGQAVLRKYYLWQQRVMHKRKPDVKVLRRAESHRLKSERMLERQRAAKLRAAEKSAIDRNPPGEFYRRGEAALFLSEENSKLQRENSRLKHELDALKEKDLARTKERIRELLKISEPEKYFPKNARGEIVYDPTPKKTPPNRRKR